MEISSHNFTFLSTAGSSLQPQQEEGEEEEADEQDSDSDSSGYSPEHAYLLEYRFPSPSPTPSSESESILSLEPENWLHSQHNEAESTRRMEKRKEAPWRWAPNNSSSAVLPEQGFKRISISQQDCDGSGGSNSNENVSSSEAEEDGGGEDDENLPIREWTQQDLGFDGARHKSMTKLFRKKRKQQENCS